MIIQTFTENAVKHGLMHKKEKGKLDIKVYLEGNILSIEIKDNGIGRKKAAQYRKMSTGKGYEIVDQIIQIYNKLYKTHVAFQVDDLTDKNGEGLGTKVNVQIPLKRG